jgi:hypothetical protein
MISVSVHVPESRLRSRDSIRRRRLFSNRNAWPSIDLNNRQVSTYKVTASCQTRSRLYPRFLFFLSINPPLHHSATPSLHHSITPSLHHSIIDHDTIPVSHGTLDAGARQATVAGPGFKYFEILNAPGCAFLDHDKTRRSNLIAIAQKIDLDNCSLVLK